MIFTNYADLEEFCAHKNELKKKKKKKMKERKKNPRVEGHTVAME